MVFNLATRARISTNATCGEREPEVFCKLVEHVQIFPAENRHCDICDTRSEQPLQRHPITNAIDGSHQWWQSPTLTNGDEFNYVTITLDLGSVSQSVLSLVNLSVQFCRLVRPFACLSVCGLSTSVRLPASLSIRPSVSALVCPSAVGMCVCVCVCGCVGG